MKHLKKLILSSALICALAAATFAGETNCPPSETAPPPCNPGETASPPCVGQSMNDGTVTYGETSLSLNEPGSTEFNALAETVLQLLSLF